MVPHFVDATHWRRSGGAVQLVQRRSAGKLRRIFSWHHALYQRFDHDAAVDGGDSPTGEACARRWWSTEDHAVDAIHDISAMHFPRLLAGTFISASGIVSHNAARNH